MNEQGPTFEEWWTEPNMVLYHGLNSDHSRDKNDPHAPIPKSGEIACSIINPRLPMRWANYGVILEPTLPRVFSFTDVGSKIHDSVLAGERWTGGTTWTPQQASMRQLMFFTMANGGYNEVLIPAEKTRIVGVTGVDRTLEEFITLLIKCLGTKYGRESSWHRSAHAMLQATYYVSLPNFVTLLKEKFRMQHKLSPLCGDPKLYLNVLFDEMAQKRVDILQLLQTHNVPLDEVFSGVLERQPITDEQKDRIRAALAEPVQDEKK